MDSKSQNTLRRLQQNDATLKEISLGDGQHYSSNSHGMFNSTNSEDYSQLGSLIATNTHLSKLIISLIGISAMEDIHWGFFDALKQNSSISQLHLYCRGRSIVGSVGHEILTAYQENGNLTDLSIDGVLMQYRDPNESNVPQHGGMNVIISTLRSCVDLKSINLRCCGIRDEHLIPMVAEVKELHLLESLWLYGNGIGRNGCDLIATLLADPNSNINTLHLSDNQINTVGALSLFNSLVNNTKLKEMYLAGNPVMGKDIKDILSRILCNTTSINDIYSSNHTLEDLSINGDRGAELRSLLEMNINRNKSRVAIKKILQYHPNIDMSPLFELDSGDERNLKGLPYVVTWFKKAKAAKRQKSVETKKLSAIYQFAQAMPMLFVPSSHIKVDDKKRKREDK